MLQASDLLRLNVINKNNKRFRYSLRDCQIILRNIRPRLATRNLKRGSFWKPWREMRKFFFTLFSFVNNVLKGTGRQRKITTSEH